MQKKYGESNLSPFDFDGVLERMPEMRELNCDVEFEITGEPIDSSDMHPGKWVEIASIVRDRYSEFDGFVVLHGSDTMAYSASALSFLLENLSKPVVLTGSQLPIGVTRTDARENLLTSIEIAAHKNPDGTASVSEVCIYFEYHLLRGNRTHKFHSEHFEAIRSPNYPPLMEAGVHLNFYHPYIAVPNADALITHSNMGSDIQVLKLFPGMPLTNIEALLTVSNMKVLLLETYGSGNAPTDQKFLDLLKRFIDNGTHVLNISQCPAGSVDQGKYKASKGLEELGLLSGGDMTFESALTKSMFLLGQNPTHEEFEIAFLKNLSGERSA